MVLCFREVGRARTSSSQMFYIYVNDIFFLQKTGWGENFFALNFLYMHINDVDIFITENLRG